jgi:two-component system osmolarity sensor histidine kinase EnvZ
MKTVRRVFAWSLFTRTLFTLIAGFATFAVLTVIVVVYYTSVPLARHASDDLAALIMHSAQTWGMLSPAAREQFKADLLNTHVIMLTTDVRPIDDEKYFLPFVAYVEKALEELLNAPVQIKSNLLDGERWFWADLKVNNEIIRMGFPRGRIKTQPLTGLILLLVFSALLVLTMAAFLARRITRPLTRLSEAAVRVGHGESLEPLPETGAIELVSFTQAFNDMARQVQELLDSRTTLLAGISHDLRTPIARLRLQVEMLQGADPDKIKRMRVDLENLNNIIEHSLELARNLKAGKREPLELREFLTEVSEQVDPEGRQLQWGPEGRLCLCKVNVVALRRILVNLMENAIRYGAEEPVDVECLCNENSAAVEISDRGVGIPDDQKEAVFRPFHRIEGSRSRDTGGSGLGLSIARQLAEANGIHVSLRDRPGGGTVARVELPPDACDEFSL